MSRIGKRLIELKKSVLTIEKGENKNIYKFSGPLGKEELILDSFIIVEQDNSNQLKISVVDENNKHQKAMWGTSNRLLKNAAEGVSTGFSLKIKMNGGYTADLVDGKILLKIGKSHPVYVNIPSSIKIARKSAIELDLSSTNKQELMQFAIEKIQKNRKMNPYTKKGIEIVGRFVLTKEVEKKK